MGSGSGDNSYGGIGAAVVEEPLVAEANEAFGEGGSGDVLAGLFVGLLGLEGGGLRRGR